MKLVDPDEDYKELNSLAHKDKSKIEDSKLTKLVKKSLKRKFDFPEWALMDEFTGKDGRRIDGLAFNMYSGRNFKIIAFEIKVSRADWKKELQSPAKNDYFVNQADEFYVVAGRKGIVKEEEIPDGWGLYEMKGGGKLYKKKESNLSETQNSETDEELYLRAVKKGLEEAMTARKRREYVRKEGYNQGYKDAKDDMDLSEEEEKLIKKGESLNKINKMLKHSLTTFSGEINEDQVEKVNQAITLIENVKGRGWGDLATEINKAKDVGEQITEKAEEAEKSLKEMDRLIDHSEMTKGLRKFTGDE